MKSIFALCLLIALFPWLAACGPQAPAKDPREEAIFGVIRKQIDALNQRDAETALTYMHPNAPGLTQSRVLTKKIAQEFELLYMIQKLNLDSVTDEEAKVSFTQITQRLGGPDFRSNRVSGVHTLRKDGEVWRIFSTRVVNIDYLDK